MTRVFWGSNAEPEEGDGDGDGDGEDIPFLYNFHLAPMTYGESDLA